MPRRRSEDRAAHRFSGPSAVTAPPTFSSVALCQHGSDHRDLHLPLPPTSDLQMAAEALLHLVPVHDCRLPAGEEDSGAVRAPADPARGRELLRLRLGEHAAGGRAAPAAPAAPAAQHGGHHVLLITELIHVFVSQRELEILMFLSAIVMMKNRRASKSPQFTH